MNATNNTIHRRVKPLLFTWPDLEEACQCSRRHLKRLLESGSLPQPIMVGGLPRFRATDIERWIESGCGKVQVAGPQPSSNTAA